MFSLFPFGFFSSSVLMPVSFRSVRSAVYLFRALFIIASSSCSVGINGILSSAVHFGGCHFLPMKFR
jgi:hypothetical protein